MKLSEMFKPKYDCITADEMNGKPVTLTIKGVRSAEMQGDEGENEEVWFVQFVETDREWRLNKTNGRALFAMWDDSDDWEGKRVTLYPAENKSGMGGPVCIRVKGSPDIDGQVEYQMMTGAPPHRKARVFTLVQTKVASRTQQKKAPAPQGDYADIDFSNDDEIPFN